MALNFPSIFLLPTHLQPDELHHLEDQIASLTYDIFEAEIVLGKITRRERALFELRRFKLETEPICRPVCDNERAMSGEEPSPKRRRVSGNEFGAIANRSDDVSRQEEREAGIIKVVRLSWLTDSLKAGEVLPIKEYILYEGKRISPTSTPKTTPKVTPKATPKKTPQPASSPVSGRDILKRAAEDQSERSAPSSAASKPRHHKDQRHTSPLQPPKLAHQTTSEHDLPLPLVPEFLKTTYSCQRPTPVDPPNEDFVEALKNIRTVRLLHGDQVGVRAYSTSIATLAAYPYPLQNAQEVARLPGCGSKIAELWHQWKSDGHLEEALAADADPMLSVLKLFYDIWGVGDTTAREFYKKGWRDLDDLVLHGWETLSRVQQIGVKYYDEFLLKIPRDEVESIAATVLNHARQIDAGYEMVIVGGYRRGKKQSGDVDILLSHRDESMTANLVEKLVMRLEKGHHITHTLILSTRNSQRGQEPLAWKGEGSGSGFDTLDKALVVWKDALNEEAPHRRVDIIVSPWKTVGCAVLGWSGGTTFQRDVRRYCKKERRLKFDSSGIRSRTTGLWVDMEGSSSGNTAPDMESAERRVFEGLGLPWREPEERCTG